VVEVRSTSNQFPRRRGTTVVASKKYGARGNGKKLPKGVSIKEEQGREVKG